MAATTAVRTHKEEQNLADEYLHEWPVTSVPRKPEFFMPVPATSDKGWSHFTGKIKERKIPGWAIRNTIENGEVFFAEGDNRYRLLWTDPASRATFSLVIELRAEAFAFEAEKHYCITMYRVEH